MNRRTTWGSFLEDIIITDSPTLKQLRLEVGGFYPYEWTLKLGDVFEDEGRVREQFTLETHQTKGGQQRSVFINKRLAKTLFDYGLDKNLSNLHRPLFESQKGRHFSANTMCQLFLDILRNYGFKDASNHSGRRTYITRLANKGVGVRLLAALAGHSHISTT